jgi:ribose/xylose/arabinose/galactoside ABC-type transport system permease subunit
MFEIERKHRSYGDIVKRAAKRLIRHENAVLLVVLLAIIGSMGVVTGGLSIRANNMRNMLLQTSVRGIASIGQAFVIMSGGIDISVGGIGLLSSIIGASLMSLNEWQNIGGHPYPIHTAIPIMLLVGSTIGLVNGSLTSRIGMPSLIVTLGMWRITWGTAWYLSGGQQVANLPSGLEWLGAGRIGGIPIPIIIFIAAAVISYTVLNYTSFGRGVYALGGNSVSAWLSGINVRRMVLIMFIISGLMAALAGIIITARVMTASMQTLEGLEIDTIASVVVGGVSLMGGRGSIIGVVIGVIMIGVVNNGMSILGADPAVQGIAKGSIIFAAVAIDQLRTRRVWR